MAAKKTFRELYDEELRKPTAAQQFIRDVSELTHRSEVTVRFWLSSGGLYDYPANCCRDMKKLRTFGATY